WLGDRRGSGAEIGKTDVSARSKRQTQPEWTPRIESETRKGPQSLRPDQRKLARAEPKPKARSRQRKYSTECAELRSASFELDVARSSNLCPQSSLEKQRRGERQDNKRSDPIYFPRSNAKHPSRVLDFDLLHQPRPRKRQLARIYDLLPYAPADSFRNDACETAACNNLF